MSNRFIRLQLASRPGLSLLGFPFLIAFTASAAIAQDFRALQWKDLIPQLAAYEDPFLALSVEQKLDLALVAQARVMLRASDAPEPSVAEKLRAATTRLQAANIRIDELLAQRAHIAAKRREAAEAVNKDLDGKLVQILGHLLPLKIEDSKVTEFLLVPYVGACIHEPTPPPNQIVHVISATGIEVTNRFAAVTVTGSLRAARSQPLLRLVDGATNVPAAYALDAQTIELYEQATRPQSFWRPQSGKTFR